MRGPKLCAFNVIICFVRQTSLAEQSRTAEHFLASSAVGEFKLVAAGVGRVPCVAVGAAVACVPTLTLCCSADVTKLVSKDALSVEKLSALQRAHNVSNTVVMKREGAPSVRATLFWWSLSDMLRPLQ